MQTEEATKAQTKRRRRVKPHQLETQARNEAGKFLTVYSAEKKEQAIQAGLNALEMGARVEEIADSMGIPRSTLYSWLLSADAQKARTAFFDGKCAEQLRAMEEAREPLDLTRARELLNGWLRVAERRDPQAYGQQTKLTVEHVEDLGDKLRRARERVIEGTAEKVEDGK